MNKFRMSLAAIAALMAALTVGVAAPADAAPARSELRPIGCC